jgi:heme-degrading monooxygenase HmoA
MAIKVLIKRKFPKSKDREKELFRCIKEIRRLVPQQPGYIASENLRSLDDKDQVVVASIWETIEAWEAWKNSEERKAYVDEFRDYYVGEAQYEHYALGLQLD